MEAELASSQTHDKPTTKMEQDYEALLTEKDKEIKKLQDIIKSLQSTMTTKLGNKTGLSQHNKEVKLPKKVNEAGIITLDSSDDDSEPAVSAPRPLPSGLGQIKRKIKLEDVAAKRLRISNSGKCKIFC